MIANGIIATWQNARFGSVYAANGGIFILLAKLWSLNVEDLKLDMYDVLGAIVALIGACIILYFPGK